MRPKNYGKLPKLMVDFANERNPEERDKMFRQVIKDADQLGFFMALTVDG